MLNRHGFEFSRKVRVIESGDELRRKVRTAGADTIEPRDSWDHGDIGCTAQTRFPETGWKRFGSRFSGAMLKRARVKHIHHPPWRSEALETASRTLWRGPPTDQAVPCHKDRPGGCEVRCVQTGTNKNTCFGMPAARGRLHAIGGSRLQPRFAIAFRSDGKRLVRLGGFGTEHKHRP